MAGEWEGGQRPGMPWRRLGLALLCIALVGGAIALARNDGGLAVDTDDRTLEGASEPADVVVTGPQQAGDRWYCPNGFPLRAFDTGYYYPPGYPESVTDLGRPEACYTDAQRAEQADYRRAPPPAGTIEAGGVYLGSAALPTLDGCREAAGATGLTVPCPTVLPAPGDASSCVSTPCEFRGAVIIEQRSFPVPPDWCDGCEAHLVLTAQKRRDGPMVACGSPHRGPPSLFLPTEDAEGDTGPGMPIPTRPIDVLVDCPDDQPPWVPGNGGYPHAGHTLTVWRRGGVTYAASIEGFGQAQRVVLRAVTDGLRYVRP